jgi:multiple sugar transport system permease protein
VAGVADVQGHAGRPARPWLSQRAREELTAYVFIMPWVIGFLIFTAGAMAFSLYISFSETDLLSLSKFIGLRNYEKALSADKLFYKSLGVTVWYTFLVVPLGTVIAMSLALMLNQKLWPIGFWRTLYYLPALVSGVAVALLWGWVLNPEYGIVNMGLKLIGVPGPRWFASEEWAVPAMVLVALWGTGTNMVLYLAGLQGIPTEIQEAARIDGAGPWTLFRHVTLPLLTPTVFFNVITSIIASFQVFNIALILTAGGPNNATLTMVLYLYDEGFRRFNFGYASAVAWLLFAIIMVFTLIVMRSSSFWVHYEGGLRR